MQDIVTTTDRPGLPSTTTVREFAGMAARFFSLDLPPGIDAGQWVNLVEHDIGRPPAVVLSSAAAYLRRTQQYGLKIADIAAAIVDGFLTTGAPVPESCRELIASRNNMRATPGGIIPGNDGRARLVDDLPICSFFGTPIQGRDLNLIVDDVPFSDGRMVMQIALEEKAAGIETAAKFLSEVRRRTIIQTKAGRGVVDERGWPTYAVANEAVIEALVSELVTVTRATAAKAYDELIPWARKGRWRTGTPTDAMNCGPGFQRIVDDQVILKMSLLDQRRQAAGIRFKIERDEAGRLALPERGHLTLHGVSFDNTALNAVLRSADTDIRLALPQIEQFAEELAARGVNRIGERYTDGLIRDLELRLQALPPAKAA